MIVKNTADAERFIQQDGTCGVGNEFCSQSCAEHGRHVAITGGRVFARGTAIDKRRPAELELPKAA